MTYQVIRALDQEVLEEHDSDEIAFNRAMIISDATGQKCFARKAPDWNWIAREQARFRDGTYEPVIWSDENWYSCRPDALRDHFLHRSSDKPEMIAFTESPEKGSMDRQTRMRAGAYLTKYFRDVLSESEIMRWARLHALANDPDALPEMKIARTADEIKRVYLEGPDSCMSEEAERYNSRPIHPVAVYGDSDLALAYVEREADFHDENIASRALIWPDRKIHGRIYPTPERYSGTARESARIEQVALARALSAAGYRAGSFEGAQIRAIPIQKYSSDTEFVMPYLDGNYAVALSPNRERFTLSRSDGTPAQNTHGTIDLNERDCMICERCEDGMDEDESYQVIIDRRHNTASWCEHCTSSHAFYCDGYEDRISEGSCDTVEVGRHTYSLWYAEDHCVMCEHTEEWVEMEDSVEVWVDEYHTELWSRDAAHDDAFRCAISELWYSNDGQESVEINGETYLRSAALKVDELAAKIAEMESESEGAE